MNSPVLADKILIGGRILTGDPAQPAAEALAVAAGRILAVGSRGDVENLAGSNTETIDVGGGLVLPGFHECHGHLLSFGLAGMRLDLKNVAGEDAVARLVADRAGRLQPGEWLEGRGWDQHLFDPPDFPTRASLDKVAPDNPVRLGRVDGHAIWVNSRALELAGVTAETSDPPSGKIVRDGSGNPTGILINRAMDLVDSVIPEPSRATREKAISQAMTRCHREGITAFHDAGSAEDTLEVLQDLVAGRRLKLRVNMMLDSTKPALLQEYLEKGPVRGPADAYLDIVCLKILADGALGSCGAALSSAYCDDPANKGWMLRDREEIREITGKALRAGYQVATHCIGDRACTEVLDAYQKALAANPGVTDARLRIEHAQLVRDADIVRMAELGVIASVQPIHCTSDMDWVEGHLGEERCRSLAYRWRDIVDAGVVLVSGSDTPIEDLSVVKGIHAAVSRQNARGEPRDGWYAGQCLNISEALASYTTAAAYSCHREKERGMLAAGYAADIATLSRDITTCSIDDILETRVVLTVVGGEVVFRKV